MQILRTPEIRRTKLTPKEKRAKEHIPSLRHALKAIDHLAGFENAATLVHHEFTTAQFLAGEGRISEKNRSKIAEKCIGVLRHIVSNHWDIHERPIAVSFLRRIARIMPAKSTEHKLAVDALIRIGDAYTIRIFYPERR